MNANTVKQAVRERYGTLAREGGSGCGCGCGKPVEPGPESLSKAVGYTEGDFASAPAEANLGLGCGNPVALAALKAGETVVDLGSGAGFDCFLAARQVGETGHVIGVDMTPEMVERAQRNAQRYGYGNVEFRRGEIEHLPLPDGCADTVISNCVINLSPDKPQVFAEAFRVLKPGGTLMVSDIVLREALPASIQQSLLAHVGCVAGALLRADYLEAIRLSGFELVEVVGEHSFPIADAENDPTVRAMLAEIRDVPQEEISRAIESVVSIKVKAVRPPHSC